MDRRIHPGAVAQQQQRGRVPTEGLNAALGVLPDARGKVHRLGPAVDTRLFSPAARADPGDRPLRVLYAGTIGLAQGVVQGRMAEVSLELSDESTSYRWEAPVWFCDPWPAAFGLLGLTGFFDHFLVTLCAYEEWIDLRPMSA